MGPRNCLSCRTVRIGNCSQCGIVITARAGSKKYCSTCAKKRTRERGRIYEKNRTDRKKIERRGITITCLVCGAKEVKITGNHKYCKKCANEAYRISEKEKREIKKPEWLKKLAIQRFELSDNYIKTCMDHIFKRDGYTPEIIELKRQQLILKRNLKILKRLNSQAEGDHHEPSNPDVSTKQCPDERHYEGQVFTRANCGSAAGI